MTITFKYNGSFSEISEKFIQTMLDSMALSEIKYGKIVDAFPDKVNAIDSMMLRLKKYKETGNKAYLVDAANFLMIESMHPLKRDAFWLDGDNKSPGRIWHDHKLPTMKGNDD